MVNVSTLRAVACMAAAFCLAAACSARVFDVREYGAKGDGVAKDTAAIQSAIDAAAKAGGGTVELPAGVYLSGSIFLADDIDFHLCAGATLKGSPDRADYNAVDVCPQNYALASESSSGGHLLLCIEKRNVTVRGPGRIDGNSLAFIVDKDGKGWANGAAGIPWRPSQMLYFVECENVRVQDVSLYNSTYWTCFLHGCTGVSVRGVEIRNHRRPVHTHNGDGIDVDCCRFVTISDCRIDTADDCITLRANGRRLKRPQDCAFVTVSNCILSTPCNAVRIGVGNGDIHDATFSNIVVHDSRTAVNFVSSWSKDRGVNIRDIRFNGMQVDCRYFLHCYHKNATDTEICDIEFDNVSGKTQANSDISGAEKSPIRRIRFRNVNLPHGVKAVNAVDLEFSGGTFREVLPGEYDIHARALTPIREKETPAGGPMKFVENGELRFSIVTNGTEHDAKAVDLLREVFAKTVGREPEVLAPSATSSLPYRLVLAADETLPKEGLSIKTSPDALTISGHTYFGSLDFAERFLGVRWYFPGEYGCIYPKRRDFTVRPVWYEDAPYFMYRGNTYGVWTSVKDKAQIEKWRPYMGQLKVKDTSFVDRWRNGSTLPGGGSHNPRPEKIAAAHPDKLKTIFYTSPQGKFWYNPKAHGGNQYNVFDLGLADILVEDWKFYLDSGRAKSADRGGFRGQVNDTFVTFGLCDTYLPLADVISHPLVKELGLITEKDLAREKDAAMANVYARFYQYLGRRVEKELPGKKLFLLCYYNSKCPSLDPRWKLPDNVEVNLCDERMPLRLRSPRHLEGLRQLFREWYEALGGRPVLKAWLYSGGTPFGRAVGPEFVGELPKAVGKYLGRGGVHYDFTTPTDLWHYYFSAYVGWRSQWNPDLDVGAAIDEMWNLCLGPKAGAKMKKFHDELKEAFVKYQAGDDAGWLAPTYPVEVIDRLDGLLRETEALIAPGSVEMRRFKLVADYWPDAFDQQRKRAAYEPPVYDVHRLMPGEKPVVDGAPDEKFWAGVEPMPLVDRFSGSPKPELGVLKLAWDEKGLYAAFESKSGAPRIGCSLWSNNTLEFFVSQGLGKEVLHQLAFDAEGSGDFQRQRLQPIPQPKDFEWKAEGHLYKARTTSGGWTAELFVPFSAFENGAPRAYDSWNFNFAVTDRSTERKSGSSASTSMTGLAHGNLAMFGMIRFAGKDD